MSEKAADVENLRIVKGILRNPDGKAICQITIDQNSAVAPSLGIPIAPVGYQSNVSLPIRYCQPGELEIAADLAQSARFEPKVAALPAVALAGIVACSAGGLFGAASEVLDTTLNIGIEDENIKNGVTASVGISAAFPIGIGKLRGAKWLGSITALGAVSAVCGKLGEMGASWGIEFVMEKWN